MADVSNLKRIVAEDFPKDQQEIIQKLAFIYNPMTEQLAAAFRKGIDFNNLNQQFSSLTLTVDGSGTPIIPVQLKYDLKTRIKGCQVISATNLTDTTYPTGTPFISYSMSNNLMTITNVAGLPANKEFTLSVILYG